MHNKIYIFTTTILCFFIVSCNNTRQKTAEPLVCINNIQFINELNMEMKKYIHEEISHIYEQRTAYWSFQPLRMFKDWIFVSDEKRLKEWRKTFENSELSYIEIEKFVNGQIDVYNQSKSYSEHLHYVHLEPYDMANILNVQTFLLIKNDELDKWTGNIWFITLWCVCLGLLLGGPFTMTWRGYIYFIMTGFLEAIINFCFLMSGSNNIIDGILYSYLDYLDTQNIIIQMFANGALG